MPSRFLRPFGLALLALTFSHCSLLRLAGVMDNDEPPQSQAIPARPKWMEAQEPAPTETPTVSITSDAETALKKRILVLNFNNRAPYGGKELGDFAATYIKDTIAKLSDYVIVPQEDVEGLETVMPDKNTPQYKALLEKARAHGIAALVTGSIEDVKLQERGDEVGVFRTRYNQASATIKFQLYDTATEQILLSKLTSADITEEYTKYFGDRTPQSYDAGRGQGAVSSAIEKTMPSFLTQVKKIAWVGQIAKIQQHRYYINAGESSGITRGQLLKVFEENKPVVDEESKALIGMAPGRFKGILRVVDYFGSDGAIAVVHSGIGFREKDRVEVYSPPPSN